MLQKLLDDIDFQSLTPSAKFLYIYISCVSLGNTIRTDERLLKAKLFPMDKGNCIKKDLQQLEKYGYIKIQYKDRLYISLSKNQVAGGDIKFQNQVAGGDIENKKRDAQYIYNNNINKLGLKDNNLNNINNKLNDNILINNNNIYTADQNLELENNNIYIAQSKKNEATDDKKKATLCKKEDDIKAIIEQKQIEKQQKKTNAVLERWKQLDNNSDVIDVYNAYVDYRKYVNKQSKLNERYGIDKLEKNKKNYYDYLEAIETMLKQCDKQSLFNMFEYLKQDSFYWTIFVSLPRSLRYEKDKEGLDKDMNKFEQALIKSNAMFIKQMTPGERAKKKEEEDKKRKKIERDERDCQSLVRNIKQDREREERLRMIHVNPRGFVPDLCFCSKEAYYKAHSILLKENIFTEEEKNIILSWEGFKEYDK